MCLMTMHLLSSIRKTIVVCTLQTKIISSRELHNLKEHVSSFKETLKSAKHVVIISGEGISTESGLPLYGSSGDWRIYKATSLSTQGAFLTFPSLVWEFYHHRREIAAKAQPNAGHTAIAQFEEKYGKEKSVTVITQSIDGLHSRAGTKNLIELHGNLYKTRCLKCDEVLPNTDNPICEALKGRGSPNAPEVNSDIPENSLPHCKKESCDGLLRLDIVWFGGTLEPAVVEKAEKAMSNCDVCLVAGQSSLMFPAALYGPEAVMRGAVVAEFNSEPSENYDFHYFFEGPCSKTLPEVLAI